MGSNPGDGLVLFDENNLPVFEQESYEEHTSAWIMVDESIEGHRWALGAVAASLTKRYGDDIVGNFASDVKSSKARIYQYAKTYQVFQKCTRVHFLSFRHHTIAARAEDPERIIELADRYELSTRELDTLVHSGELPERHRAIETPDAGEGGGGEETQEPEILQIEPVARDPKVLTRYELEEIAAKAEKERVEEEKSRLKKESKKDEQAARIETLKATPLPERKYSTIVIDPPWSMQKIDRDERPNQHGFDYPTMTEDELRNFEPMQALPAQDCHLYLWTTHKHLPTALRLAEAWGFRYECLMTWVKNVGFTPYSWMRSTEHVLFCRRGSLDLQQLGRRLDFQAKVREHSRKPDEFYDLVREVSPGPRIDVFSREERPDFDSWGNESERFSVA